MLPSLRIYLMIILYIYILGSLVYNSIEVINMATERPRYTVSVDDELFRKIEDFRFEQRIQTRSEATVELIRLGLEVLSKEQEETKKNKNNQAPEPDE